MINIVRERNTGYVVNIRSEGGLKRYEWAGSRGDKKDIKPIPEDVVNHLLMSSRCFSDGELKIVEDSEESKEIISNIDNLEQYENNTHSRETILKILSLPVNKLKAELNKITILGEKNFLVEVAKDSGLDSASKRTAIANWLGTPADILFEDDEAE